MGKFLRKHWLFVPCEWFLKHFEDLLVDYRSLNVGILQCQLQFFIPPYEGCLRQ